MRGHAELGPGRPQRAADGPVRHRPVRRAGDARCRWRWSRPGSPTRAGVMKPYLVKSVRGANLDIIQSAPDPVELSQAVSEQTASTLTRMMVGRRRQRHRRPGPDRRCRRRRQDRHRPARPGQAAARVVHLLRAGRRPQGRRRRRRRGRRRDGQRGRAVAASPPRSRARSWKRC